MPNMTRTEDVIINDGKLDLCPLYSGDREPERKRRFVRSAGNPVFGITGKLWPATKITAGVSVLNTANDGDLSNLIEFTTPDGGKTRRNDFFEGNLLSIIYVNNIF